MFISPSLHLTKLSRCKFLKNLFSNCYMLQRVNVQTATNCCAYCQELFCKIIRIPQLFFCGVEGYTNLL